MQVFTRTISAVFGTERRYVVPLFQRPYVWTREAQLEPLWEDIANCAEEELAGHGEPAGHFLGAVVIQQRKSWGDQLLAHDVIDGQQRLTTFQILVAAVRDVATQLGEAGLAAWWRSLSENANAVVDRDVESFKVWPTARDSKQFCAACTAGSKAALEEAYPPKLYRKRLQPRPRLVEAYLYFYDVVREWLESEGRSGVGDRLRALRRVLDRRLQLVSIELDGQEDPQSIFETLNARGVPLLASDLLRNFIFQRAAAPADAEQLHSRHWARFERLDDDDDADGQRFWEVEERQGRLVRARLDLFVQHFLSMKTTREISSGRLFVEYKAWIERDRPYGSDVEQELKDLGSFAAGFELLLAPDPATPLGQFAERLRVLDTSTIYPLVLWLVGSGTVPSAEQAGIYQDLESFLVRRLICGRTTKNYNRLFLQVLRACKAQSVTTRAGFQTLLNAGSGEAVDWPSDAEFEAAWSEIDAYRALKPTRLEMLFRALEEALTTSKTEKVTIHGKLTVEHVMPQTWKQHWPLPDGDPDAMRSAREELIHDFGNLTLITQPLNSAVKNGPPAAKLPEIAIRSRLGLNTVFQNRVTWTEKDIAERSRNLAKLAIKVWPRPEAEAQLAGARE